MENENKFVSSVQCADSTTNVDNNGNTCASYSNLITCTDCACDAADNLVNFIAEDNCCSCEGGYSCGREQALEIFDTDLNTWTEIKTSGKVNVNGQNCTEGDSSGTYLNTAGNACDWYKWNTAACGVTGDGGTGAGGSAFDSNAMCCACGGGTRVDVDNTASYPWITSVNWASDTTGSSYGKIIIQPDDENIIPAGET